MTIEDMRARAELKGGKCLSKEYINSTSKLLWLCEEGHVWETTPDVILQGGWCPRCFGNRRKHSIEDMQQLAAKWGGKCLSKKYINSNHKLFWQCSRGHQWKTTPIIIKIGHWCNKCREENRKTAIFSELCKIAKEKGGKCLSKGYISSRIKLKWQCKEKHRWKALPYSIKEGRWCNVCYNKSRLLTMAEMHQIAAKHGGKCLSEKYFGNRFKLKWQCREGHRWDATPGNIKKGRWCPLCFRKTLATRQALQDGLEQMQKIAHSYGGKCLSDKYTNYYTPLLFQCRKGHKWKANPGNIKNGTWCPICGKKVRILKDGLEQMRKIAELRGGKCLEPKYLNSRVKVKWECSRGHVWKAPFNSVKTGCWCKKCFYISRKKLIVTSNGLAPL